MQVSFCSKAILVTGFYWKIKTCLLNRSSMASWILGSLTSNCTIQLHPWVEALEVPLHFNIFGSAGTNSTVQSLTCCFSQLPGSSSIWYSHEKQKDRVQMTDEQSGRRFLYLMHLLLQPSSIRLAYSWRKNKDENAISCLSDWVKYTWEWTGLGNIIVWSPWNGGWVSHEFCCFS